MVAISIEKFDDAQLQRALDGFIKAGSNASPLFKIIGEELTDSHQSRWGAGQAPDGSAWKRLSPLTRLTKKTTKMLYEEGDMLSRPVSQISADELVFGLTDKKAIWHHEGTDPYEIVVKNKQALAFGGGLFAISVDHPGLPARPLVGLSKDDDAMILEEAQAFLMESAGLGS